MIQNQFSKSIKIIQSDNGIKYVNSSFAIYFTQRGIIHQKTCPYISKQNGLSERKHKHIIEATNTFLTQTSLTLKYWLETLSIALFLINQLPFSTIHQKSPFKVLYGHPPTYLDLRVFGCLCYPWPKPYSPNK